jgi:hypothetical protein
MAQAGMPRASASRSRAATTSAKTNKPSVAGGATSANGSQLMTASRASKAAHNTDSSANRYLIRCGRGLRPGESFCAPVGESVVGRLMTT